MYENHHSIHHQNILYNRLSIIERSIIAKCLIIEKFPFDNYSQGLIVENSIIRILRLVESLILNVLILHPNCSSDKNRKT